VRTLKNLAAFAGVALATNAALAASLPRDEAAWEIVPDQALSNLRGGIDIPQNNLVAYFAIQRVISVDGQVVARMQIVISNLDSGGLPTISVSGATAALVQIMNAFPVSAPALPTVPAITAPAVTPASAAAPSAATPAAATGVVATASAPATATPAVSGTISKTNVQSGSSAQFGSALASATAAASGTTSGSGANTSSSPTSGASGAAAPTVAASASGSTSAPVATSPASVANAASVGASAASSKPISQIVPVGTAPLVVVSNLPNATAITTAVQNDVRAATIQIQTTITATVNSLLTTNSLSLANAIKAQVAGATP
jgi:hypothetical protein